MHLPFAVAVLVGTMLLSACADPLASFPSFQLGTEACSVTSSGTINEAAAGWTDCAVNVIGGVGGTVSTLLLVPGGAGDFIDPGPGNLLVEVTITSPANTVLTVDGYNLPTDTSARMVFGAANGGTVRLSGSTSIGRNLVSDFGAFEFDANLNGVIGAASDADFTFGGDFNVDAAAPQGGGGGGGVCADLGASCEGEDRFGSKARCDGGAVGPCHCAAAETYECFHRNSCYREAGFVNPNGTETSVTEQSLADGCRSEVVAAGQTNTSCQVACP